MSSIRSSTHDRPRVLIVEDERDIRELMQMHLMRDGFEVTAVEEGEEGLRLLKERPYHVAVVDWMLPGVSGLELCRQLSGKLPILMVTARAEAADIVLGLEAGADDYITKPFEVPVFLARVRALRRRADHREVQTAYQVGGLTVRADSHEVSCHGETLKLTASEFKLLTALLENRGKVLSRDRLIALVQGAGVTVTDRTVDTHVFGLRKKLGLCAELIETIRGVGYRVKME